MALYRYVKRQTQPASAARLGHFNLRFLAGLMVVVGLFFLINAAYPIISYQLLVSPRFSTSFISPNSEAAIAQTFGSPQSGAEVLGTEIDLVDYTKASNWFPEEKVSFAEQASASYQVSIPKLGIDKAIVVVGMEDLKKSLIQYPGTVAPGRFGNTVIFGHSVLPQFFNPKNYVSIFSTLPALKFGDEIFVDYNQVRYRYVVEQMIEVIPNDISILAQRYDDSYLTLITCVPPGTYLKRLIVRGRLTKI